MGGEHFRYRASQADDQMRLAVPLNHALPRDAAVVVDLFYERILGRVTSALEPARVVAPKSYHRALAVDHHST